MMRLKRIIGAQAAKLWLERGPVSLRNRLGESENHGAPPPEQEPNLEIRERVSQILESVRQQGDKALRKFSLIYDGVELHQIRVPGETLDAAREKLPAGLKDDVLTMAAVLKKGVEMQLSSFQDKEIEIEPGIWAGQKIIPLERVGVYVPGGRYPLFSSLVMGVVPAQAAGVTGIAVCSPPAKQRRQNDLILGVASLLGVSEVYQIGGAQAIGALAWGTETVKAVDKIVGPGNKYVREAKRLVFGEVGLDCLAGPTEIMIIGDESSHPEFIAADLVAQAEHDQEAQCILVVLNDELADEVEKYLEKVLREVSSGEVAENALKNNGVVVIVSTVEEAIEVANTKAPEHLELQVKEPHRLIPGLKHFGTLFVGSWSGEAIGDYCGGVNHILPTGRTARYRGGLNGGDFVKIVTTLRVNEEGAKRLGPLAQRLAQREGLRGHAYSVGVRLAKSQDIYIKY